MTRWKHTAHIITRIQCRHSCSEIHFCAKLCTQIFYGNGDK